MKYVPYAICRIALLLTITGALLDISSAEPYMALRGGYKCGQCHVNRTGGGMRTGFGVIYEQTVLPNRYVNPVGEDGFFDAQTINRISFGANLRVANKVVLGVDRPRGSSRFDNTVELPEGNIYLRFDLIRELLTFYLDETVLPSGARNREAFLLIHSLPMNAYLKAGRMLLPFGFRILDDESFIRQKTGYNYDNQDIGYEVGFEPGPYSFSLAVTNGTQGAAENNVDKQMSFIGSVVLRNLRIGGSIARNKTPGEPSDQITMMYSTFAGLQSGRISLIGEADMIRAIKEQETAEDQEERERFGDQLALYSSLNFQVIRGVNLRIAYDYFDPRIKLEEDERIRLTFGLEVFPFQFFQISAYYRILESIPQRPQENEDQAVVELHIFF